MSFTLGRSVFYHEQNYNYRVAHFNANEMKNISANKIPASSRFSAQ